MGCCEYMSVRGPWWEVRNLMPPEFAFFRLNRDSNLGRIYRTIWTLCGPTTIHLIECEAKLAGNHFSARGKLALSRYTTREDFLEKIGHKNIIAFEKGGHPTYDNSPADIYLFGGENMTLRQTAWPMATFQSLRTKNELCLLAEVAVAVVAYGQNQ